MKYLGIDHGTKRIGVATSDDSGVLAFPLAVIEVTSLLIAELKGICEKEGVERIVIGESRNFSNEPNPLLAKTRAFAALLEDATRLPIVWQSEVLTSQEAMRVQGDNEMNDASAAAIILQSYLDRVNDRPSVDEVDE
jgi:putative Holliday junction resolvase